MIRKAAPNDLQDIVNLRIKAVKDLPRLLISRDRIFTLTRECVSGAQHFAWVAEKDGVIGGVILAIVHPNMSHERCCATIVELYSELPGEGVNLLREFLRWARRRPIIKRIVFNIERESDPRLGKLLARLGLSAQTIYTETR